MAPSVEERESGSSQQTITAGLNLVTENFSLGMSGMNQWQRGRMYHPASFVSKGENTFAAPKISMTNPVVKGEKNKFVGSTEFKTLYNIDEGHSSRYSTGISGEKVLMASVGGGREHHYVENEPEMGVYGDVEIKGGSLKNDSVPIHGNITGDYSYSYRVPRKERDSWGVDLQWELLSAESFANAVQSALTGYGAGKLTQKLGAGDFVASLMGSLASASASDTNGGLTSQGHISEVHNDDELEIDLIGFNKEQFNAEMTQIRQTVFDNAIEEGATTEEAQKIAEDEVKEVEQDLATFKEKVKEVKESIEKARKREAEGKSVIEENTRSGVDDMSMDLLLNPPTDEVSILETPYSERFFELLREKGDLTPREEMIAYVPKNAKERELKRITLLRYEAEDLIAKHPEAADLFGKIFVGAMYGLQGAEYMGAAVAGGPIGVAVKYASQEAISFAIDTTIEETSSKTVENMAVSPAVKEEFKTTLKVSAYVGLGFGSIKASKELVGTLTKSAAKGKFSLQKTFTKAEMKELLASKANDNVFLMNDNGIYMSKGKVVNGESVGVGRVSSSVVDSIESKILNSAGSDAKLRASKSGRNSSKRAVFVETKSGEKARKNEKKRDNNLRIVMNWFANGSI